MSASRPARRSLRRRPRASRPIPCNHPGGATGYRFAHGGRSVCYISDIEHSEPWPDPGLSSASSRGADLVIYDGMFSEAEYPTLPGWGHSTWQKGVELCQAADVEGAGDLPPLSRP